MRDKTTTKKQQQQQKTFPTKQNDKKTHANKSSAFWYFSILCCFSLGFSVTRQAYPSTSVFTMYRPVWSAVVAFFFLPHYFKRAYQRCVLLHHEGTVSATKQTDVGTDTKWVFTDFGIAAETEGNNVIIMKRVTAWIFSTFLFSLARRNRPPPLRLSFSVFLVVSSDPPNADDTLVGLNFGLVWNFVLSKGRHNRTALTPWSLYSTTLTPHPARLLAKNHLQPWPLSTVPARGCGDHHHQEAMTLDWARDAQGCQLHHQSCNPLDARGKAEVWSTEDNLATNCESRNEELEPQPGHHPEAGQWQTGVEELRCCPVRQLAWRVVMMMMMILTTHAQM